jgi:hypothetical protein
VAHVSDDGRALSLTIRPGQCQAWSFMAGGLGCGLQADHVPPAERAGAMPAVSPARHLDPATGWPWHTETDGTLVLGPPPGIPRRAACPIAYIWQTPAGAIELHCDRSPQDSGAGPHGRHRDPVTGWHWRATADGLTVEARP